MPHIGRRRASYLCSSLDALLNSKLWNAESARIVDFAIDFVIGFVIDFMMKIDLGIDFFAKINFWDRFLIDFGMK